MYHPTPDGPARLKLYRLGGAIALSDAVPVLENFGFRVIEEVPTALADEQGGYVHDFAVEAATAFAGDARVLEGAIERVLEGQAENDAFNRLIVDLNATPAAVVLFRAWFRYLRQAGLSYGLMTVVDALRRAPAVAAALIARFESAHKAGGSKEAVAAADAAIAAGLNAVSAIDDDRILRAYWGVIRACLRTNAYAPAAAEALAFKLDSLEGAGPARAAAVARSLGLFAAGRGHPFARRPGRARRPALVRPARRFPHRNPRPDEGAAREERRDRADRRQGRLLSQAIAEPRGRPRRVVRRRDRKLPHLHPHAACRSPTISSTARSCIRRA